MKTDQRDYDISFDNYIKDEAGEFSICREERQYALFLSNILRYYSCHDKREQLRNRDPEAYKFLAEIFRVCSNGKAIEEKRGADGGTADSTDRTIRNSFIIKEVYYEAAFMRDFLERKRRIELTLTGKNAVLNKTFRHTDYSLQDKDHIFCDSFNYRLLNYVIKSRSGKLPLSDEAVKAITEVNYGHNSISIDLGSDEKLLLRSMMNAKPDIAVIYEEGNKNYLLFLECKFESGEDYYKDSENKEIEHLSQREVQWHIADFLTSSDEEKGCHMKYKGKEVNCSLWMKEEEGKRKSVKVEFCRKKHDDRLEISKLIQIEKKLFI